MRRRALGVCLPVLLLLIAAVPASAATTVASFDDLDPNTRVSTEYAGSHGLSFPSAPGERPLVKQVGAKAHSGDRVGVYSCEGLPGCGEGFSEPVLRGQLAQSANAVSAWVGWYRDPAFPINPGDPVESISVRIRAFTAEDALVAESAYVTVTEDAPLSQQVVATSPAGAAIDYFVITADKPGENSAGRAIAIDDVTVTIDDSAPPPPPNFTLNQGQTVVDVLTGTSVDVPVEINRINGSNGDISFAASGLPAGMTASFAPNPVPGTGASTVMTLTAAEGAAHSDQYSDVTVTATPTSPGAGSMPRSITKSVRIRENCDRTLRADYVDARSASCMVRRGSAYEVTNAEVRVNGLIIKPADDSRPTLVIDPQAKTIKGRSLTMPFTVAADADPDIPIYAGPISWSFKEGDGPRQVAGFDLSGVPSLKSLPITGMSASFTRNGDALLKPTLRLGFWPFNYFGSITTTTTTFTVDNDNPPDFTGLELKVAKVNALGIELKDVALKWRQGGTWSGSAKLVLRFAKTYTVGAGFGIKEGKFDFLNGSVSGLNQSIGAGIFLQRLGFAVQRSPLSLSGSIGLSGGPSVAGRKAVTVDGTVKATFADPFVVEVAGELKIADRFELADAFLRYSSTGLFEFGGSVEFDIWALDLDGRIDGWVDGFEAFNVEGSLDACLDVWGPNPCGSAKAILSSRGIAGCVGVYGYYVGAGAKWALPPDFDAFTGCDLAPYRATKPSAIRGAAQIARTTLPKGLPSAAWEVTAEGGPTGVTLIGPNGEAVTVSRELPVVQNDRFYAQLREDGTTFVLVNRPAAGAWTLSDDGTAPVTRVREARGLPKASAKATVRGRGRSRVLSWNLRRIPGQRVTFAEIGKNVRNAIRTTSSARGSVRFRPADGPAGKRSIVAIVEQGGQPRTTLRAGSYRAPGPPKPAKPRSLQLVRRGSRLTVSWRPRSPGLRHAVYLQVGDGRRVAQVLDRKRRSYTLKGVSSRVGAKVKVVALTAGNAKGPPATRSIKPRRARAG